MAALFGVVFSLLRPVVDALPRPVVFSLLWSFLLALVFLAVAPGAPFIPPLVAMAGQDSHEAVRLTAALTVVAVALVPLFIAVGAFPATGHRASLTVRTHRNTALLPAADRAFEMYFRALTELSL